MTVRAVQVRVAPRAVPHPRAAAGAGALHRALPRRVRRERRPPPDAARVGQVLAARRGTGVARTGAFSHAAHPDGSMRTLLGIFCPQFELQERCDDVNDMNDDAA